MFAALYGHALRLSSQLELTPKELLLTRANRDSHLILATLGGVSLLLLTLRPGWTVPLSGFLYGLIGPLMSWHWRRVKRAMNAAPENGFE